WLDCFWNSLTGLDVSNNTALTNLFCGYNSLTGLNVSGATALTILGCWSNYITSLDVTNNTALTDLDCNSNSLTGLDVSKNTALTYLDCNNNSLTGLDVSNNTALTELYCDNNSLTSLDVRNANNTLLFYCWSFPPYTCFNTFDATNNPFLYCISVDDTAYSNANWSSKKDSWAVFSNDCMTVGIKDNEPSQPTITTANNTITIEGNGTASIYNLRGQRIHHSKLTGKNTIFLEKGIYLVRVQDGNRGITKKVYVN
ncbi:MAG: leucine-rich repeat domain-containing protein, partial [Bacteroidetes bacterium]|nr:leucine-rich repeat domain-containing protein [Bacteroidota bacterium]